MFGSGVISYADKVDDLKKEKQNQEQKSRKQKEINQWYDNSKRCCI